MPDATATDGDAVLSVFYEGTANPISYNITQVSLFFERCSGHDLSSAPFSQAPGGERSFKLGYDGCGHAYGIKGTVFATGLDKQVADTKSHLETLLKSFKGKVTVNAFGLSRGGIAVMMLARALEAMDPARVALNALLFDPVPGNLISVARLDCFRMNMANIYTDLTKCATLRSVLGIYPHEPLPSIAFHAPVVPIFPSSNCQVELEVVLGCHQGALFIEDAAESVLSYVRIRGWMEARGSKFGNSRYPLESRDEKSCLRIMNKEVKRNAPTTTRSCHYNKRGGLRIVRRRVGVYMNPWHEELAQRLGGDDEAMDRVSRTSNADAGQSQYLLDFVGLREKYGKDT